MEHNEPMTMSNNEDTSPISKGSKPESDALPSLVDEDTQLKARISTMESTIKDLVDLVKDQIPKKKKKAQGPRQSGERSRLIFGDDLYHLPDSDDPYETDDGKIPDLKSEGDSEDSSSDGDSDAHSSEKSKKKGSRRSSGKMRESVMYKSNSKDREHLRDAHLRATAGSSIVVPQKFVQETIEVANFIRYKELIRKIDEHEANPHNLPVFPFRFYSEKAKQQIVNKLKTYHGNPRNKKYDPTMAKIAPTERELNLMLTAEFCVSFERMMRPSDQQHYEQIFRSVISTFKNQRMSDSIMAYNSFAIDVENLFILARDLVIVLGETDKKGKLFDYYPPMRPMKAYDLEGLIPLLCVSWPPAVLLEVRKKMGDKESKCRLLTDWMIQAKKVIDSYRESNERWVKLMSAFSNSEKSKKRAQLSKFTEGVFSVLPGEISSDEDGDLYDQQLAYHGYDSNKVGQVHPDESESSQDNFAAFTRPLAMPIGIPTKKKEYSPNTTPKLTLKRDDQSKDLSKLPCWGEVQGKGNCKRDNCPFSHDRALLNGLAKSINSAMEERNKAVSFRSMEAGRVIEPPATHYE